MTRFKNTIRVSLSLEEAAERIEKRILGDSVSGELIDKYEIAGSEGKVLVMVFEKFYYRAGNRLTLTLTIDDYQGESRIHYVGGGGGTGSFIKFDWGAAEAFENSIEFILHDYIIV